MTQKPTSAMLFAAGMGTRMRPLTDNQPKALVNVAGRALIDHAIDVVTQAKIKNIIVNGHYNAEMIQKHLANTPHHFQYEETLLETGGGLKKALPLLGDPLVTLNTDAIWGGPNPLNTLMEQWRDKDDSLLLLQKRDVGNFSMAADGTLTRGGPWIYTGAQILRPKWVRAIPDDHFSLNRVWDDLIDAGCLKGVPFSGLWCDVGTPSSIIRAEELIASYGK